MDTEILYIDNGIVKLTEEGFSLPSFHALYDKDKNKGKPTFKNYITYIWYIYSKGSPYANLGLNERIAILETKHLDKKIKKWTSLLSVKEFKDCVDEYSAIIVNREERQYENLMNEIDAYIKYLENIPTSYKKSVVIDVKDPETGDIHKKNIDMEFNNIDDKIKANTNIKKMYELADYYRDRIKNQGVVKKKRYHRLFDKKES